MSWLKCLNKCVPFMELVIVLLLFSITDFRNAPEINLVVHPEIQSWATSLICLPHRMTYFTPERHALFLVCLPGSLQLPCEQGGAWSMNSERLSQTLMPHKY